MGVSSRDYMNEGPRRSWMPGRVTWWLIGIHVVLWFIHASAINSARDPLAPTRADSPVAAFIEGELHLHPAEVFGSLKLWQPLTAFWFHDVGGIGQLFWNMLLLFFFGRAVEGALGGTRYLWLYIGGGVASMLATTGLAYATVGHSGAFGAHGALYAVLVWLACREPHRTILVLFVVPAPLWVAVGLFMIGGELVDLVALGSIRATAFGHLVGAGWGAFYFWRFSRTAAPEGRPRRPWWGKRAHYVAEVAPDPARGVKQEVDRLLAKIAADGMESLSEAEKAFLQQASKRYK